MDSKDCGPGFLKQIQLISYPTHFISHLRLSGLLAKSLFSQYKHSSGGKFNFVTSRAAHLVKQSVSSHHSGKQYRDQLLDTVEVPLHKKQYNRQAKKW